MLLGALMGIVVIALLMTYVLRCPCELIPGSVLFGVEVEELVSDWSFANSAELCQIQAGRHSLVCESQLHGRRCWRAVFALLAL